MNQKRLKWIKDINMYPLEEDYILESKSKDIYCVINKEAYDILNLISEELTIESLCSQSQYPKSVKDIVDEIIDLGLIILV